MAVELCRDSSSRGLGMMSPRISFSHDLNQSEIIPIDPFASSLLDYDYDFDFCVSKRSCDQDSSLADELFADGIILPVEIRSKTHPTKPKSFYSSPPSPSPVHGRDERETTAEEEGKEREEKQGSKSFWKFKRSKSFNCRSLYKRGLFWPLPLLSRSKSTGSTATDKRDEAYHEQNQNLNQNHGGFNGGLKQCYQKNSSKTCQNHQKPPLLKKNLHGSSSYNYGVGQVSPVINVPTEKLFSIFSNAKDKGKKK